jgi:hypothetical protein
MSLHKEMIALDQLGTASRPRSIGTKIEEQLFTTVRSLQMHFSEGESASDLFCYFKWDEKPNCKSTH